MNPESILIAEDSPTQSLRLQNMLEKNGFSVTAACDGRVALDTLAHFHPTLVISDVQMPEMDGYELCRHLKADPALKRIPLILLTSLSAPHDIIRGLECGADNFVVKPYDDDFLLARIRAVLANRALGPPPKGAAIPVFFAGKLFAITADRRQILNLLLSTYETAVKTNSDLIAAHEALKAAQAQLIEAEKLQTVGRLAAGVAHEVRNPLAILEMGLEVFADQPLDETGRMIFGEMKEAVKRASDVISGLMDLGSPEQLGTRETNLHALLDLALGALSDEIARRDVEVVRHLAPTLPEPRVDAAKIEQLFINVLTNALQAMPAGGTLTITTRETAIDPELLAFDAGNRGAAQFREGERVIVVEIADTGAGIASENLNKVFEPFFSTKPTGQGMGLGLTVAKKIVEVHRGRIQIRNRESGGATVTMTFKTE
ncbi:MAG TPA: response regulator [Chthoniobacteraceae bacterium]|nr:response regulator [Chthoniobacteraceae bacterium]